MHVRVGVVHRSSWLDVVPQSKQPAALGSLAHVSASSWWASKRARQGKGGGRAPTSAPSALPRWQFSPPTFVLASTASSKLSACLYARYSTLQEEEKGRQASKMARGR